MLSRSPVLARGLLGAAVAIFASGPVHALADRPARAGVFVLGVDGMDPQILLIPPGRNRQAVPKSRLSMTP